MKIIIGTPIHRPGAYILDKFIANQKQIQEKYPDCELLLATDDPGFADEVKTVLKNQDLKWKVITFTVTKPGYAKSRLWNIAGSREAIRQHILADPAVEGLVFLDSDMTYDPEVIEKLLKPGQGSDVVFSGTRLKNNQIGLAGAGCLLLKRKALEKIYFRCYEFRNGQVINEDNVLERDLFIRGLRIKKGIYVANSHYVTPDDVKTIQPQKIGLILSWLNSPLPRYLLIELSIEVHYNLGTLGQRFLWRLRGKPRS